MLLHNNASVVVKPLWYLAHYQALRQDASMYAFMMAWCAWQDEHATKDGSVMTRYIVVVRERYDMQ